MLRFSKKRKIIALLIALGVVLGAILVPWSYKKYKFSRYDQLGDVSIEKGEWRVASFWYQKALELSPNNIETLQKLAVNADYFNDPQAVDFWSKISEATPDTITNKTSLLKALLRNNQFSEAKQVLHTIAENEDPEFYEISSSYFLSIGDLLKAETAIRKAFQLSGKANEFRLQLLNVLLRKGSRTNKDEVEKLITEIRKDQESEADLLRVFIDYSVNKNQDKETLAFLNSLVEKDAATWVEKLEYLKLNIVHNPGAIDPILHSLSKGPVEPIFLEKVSTTLLSRKLPELALSWLNSQNKEPLNQQLSFQIPYADTLAKLEKWDELLSFLEKQKWEVFDYYRNALMARTYKSLGDEIQSMRAWRTAVKQSNEVVNEQLRLAQMVENWEGFEKERLNLLEEMLVYSAHGSWAYKKLHKYYRENGDIWDLYKISVRGEKARPKDMGIKINKIFYSLLLEREIEDNYITSKTLLAEQERNESVLITHALACIKMNKLEEGIQSLLNLNTRNSITPELAHYLVILHRKANKVVAPIWLEKASKALLFEEERRL